MTKPKPITTDDSLAAVRDYTAVLANAHLPQRTVDVCLRGDVTAELQQIEAEIIEVRKSAQTLADRGKLRELADRAEALAVVAREATVPFLLQGLGPRTMRKLEIEHPPKDPDDGMQWNLDTFAPALVAACLVGPITAEQWLKLYEDEKVTDGQVDELFGVALTLSKGKVNAPFSPAASAILRNSGETSEQPAP